MKFKEAIKNGSFLIGYFSECKDHNCGIQDCEAARRRSVRYIEGCLYGLFNPRQKKLIIERFLWSEHLFVTHILLYEADYKSKFLPQYACVEELYKLFELTIKASITNNATRHRHWISEGFTRNVIYYRATFD